MKLFDLKGKTAIVTGGNGGIGLGIARGLSEAGANLVIVGRNVQKNQKAVASLRAENRSCLGLACDVSLKEDIDRCIEDTLTEFGRIDILVNNAGVSGGGAPEKLQDEV